MLFTEERKKFRAALAPRLKLLLETPLVLATSHLTESEYEGYAFIKEIRRQMQEWLVDFWTETEDVPGYIVRGMLADILREFGIKMKLNGMAGIYKITDDRFLRRTPGQCLKCGHANLEGGCGCCDAEAHAVP